MEQQGGKRVQVSTGLSRGGKIAIAIIATLVTLVAASYAGLCAYVQLSGTILPNLTAGDIPLGGLTRREAVAALDRHLDQYATQSVTFTCGGENFIIPGDLLVFDHQAVADAALAYGRPGNAATGGAWFLAALAGGEKLDIPLSFRETPPAIAAATDLVDNPVEDSTWALEGDNLVFRKGVSGQAVDGTALVASALEQFHSGTFHTIAAPITVAPPADPDFDAIFAQVDTAAADAYLDPESKKIIPAVTGVSFDMGAVRGQVSAAAEGSTISIPLTYAQPAVSTDQLNATLFRDVLGSSTTKCSGPSNRWYNITLASSFVNDMILMPGEVFSYNEHCGPYTPANGYRKAGAYQNGKTVDTTAGGICQLSSTLYWTTLKANLETVERTKHKYDVGYLPTGMDATVYSDTLDFKFKNSTEYPIKITAYQDSSHKLQVSILGTDTTGIHGEPYANLISTTAATNQYEANNAKVALGGAPIRDPERTPYNGKKVETHQRLVDKDGKTISDTVIHVDSYSSRTGVYFYNSGDAARLGIDPATGTKSLPPVTPTPSAIPTTPVVPTAPMIPTTPVIPIDPTPPATVSPEPLPTPAVPTPTPVVPTPTPVVPTPTPVVPTPTPTPAAPLPEPTPTGPGMEPSPVPTPEVPPAIDVPAVP